MKRRRIVDPLQLNQGKGDKFFPDLIVEDTFPGNNGFVWASKFFGGSSFCRPTGRFSNWLQLLGIVFVAFWFTLICPSDNISSSTFGARTFLFHVFVFDNWSDASAERSNVRVDTILISFCGVGKTLSDSVLAFQSWSRIEIFKNSVM